MTPTEIWITYHFASRANIKESVTTQLIELEFQNHKLVDLEDVLDHVFHQGFVEAKYRSMTWWETKDGVKIKNAATVEEVLCEGVGKCPETSLRLVIQDVPRSLWFTYVYKHNSTAPSVTQRIKLPILASSSGSCPALVKVERLAHLTNYVFSQGYLPPKYRTLVHWEGLCGKIIEECLPIGELLSWAVGVSEERPLRLVIDAPHPKSSVVAKPKCTVTEEPFVFRQPPWLHLGPQLADDKKGQLAVVQQLMASLGAHVKPNILFVLSAALIIMLVRKF